MSAGIADDCTADCAGDAYYTYTLHDGTGQEHSITAMAGAASSAFARG